jgi:hypothetical protein
VYKQAPGFRPGPCERDASACISRHQAFALTPVSCSPTETAAAGNPLLTRSTLSAEVSLVAAVSTEAKSRKAATMSAAPNARVSTELITPDMHTMGCRAATTGSRAKAKCLHIHISIAPLPAGHLDQDFEFKCTDVISIGVYLGPT